MSSDLSPIPPEAETRLPAPGSRAGRAARWLLARYPVWPIVEHLAAKRVPRHRHSAWYAMGGIVLFLFAVQVITGILLMVYYDPGQPWQSVQRIVMEIPYGALVRSIHHWAANLMILAIFLHLFSTFFLKAYRPPRELTWVTGLVLAGLAMAFGFSGYLLPWDDLSFFATRVGISEIEKAPLVGGFLADLVRGGPDVTVATINRFYPLHVVVLPLLILGLIGAHLTFVQVQGVSEPDAFRALPPEQRKYHKFFGEFLVAEIPVWLALGVLLVALAALAPRALDPEANPAASAPEGIKPEWYFLSQYQALKLFPGSLELLGQALLGLVPLAMLAVPFWDRSIPADARGRLATRLGIAGLAGLVAMTLWGWLS